MNRYEVVELLEEWLTSVPELKKRLKVIDVDFYDNNTIKGLQQEGHCQI